MKGRRRQQLAQGATRVAYRSGCGLVPTGSDHVAIEQIAIPLTENGNKRKMGTGPFSVPAKCSSLLRE
jgi:hypothetical protein